MNTQIRISTFDFKSNPVRIELIDNEPFFCLADVCSVLNIKNSRRVSSDMLNEDGVRKTYIIDALNRQQEITVINEPNLYRIIFRSNKAEAIEFQNWVFEEVLPQIRKTGSYSQNIEPIRPLEPTYHCEHTQTEMLCFASLWFSLYNCRDTLEQVSEPLMALGARLGSTAYTHATEYRNTLGLLQRILVKLLDGIETDEPHYRKALATLRGYQPRRLARIAKR